MLLTNVFVIISSWVAVTAVSHKSFLQQFNDVQVTGSGDFKLPIGVPVFNLSRIHSLIARRCDVRLCSLFSKSVPSLQFVPNIRGVDLCFICCSYVYSLICHVPRVPAFS